MCRLVEYCTFDSARQTTYSLSEPKSRGQLRVIVLPGESLREYSLESYFGNRPIKRPDRLLVGKVGNGPWVVILLEGKSGTGWSAAVEKFEEVLPVFCKGNKEGEHFHYECGVLAGKGHRVIALVAGRVGSEYRQYKRRQRGDRKPVQRDKLLYCGGKAVPVLSPRHGKEFESVSAFWKDLGVLPLQAKR